MQELRQDSNINVWLDNLNGSKQTVKSYLQAMQAYTEFTKMSTEELITEAENEAVSRALTRHRKLKGYLIGYRKSLQDSGLADLTVRARMAGVKSFYESFEIVLPKLQGERRKAKTLTDNNTIPSKEDLQECLGECDVLEKAVLLVGASSGLASNEVRNLKLKDYKKGLDESGVCTLPLIRQKTGVEFITFLSSEATKAVNKYLEDRDLEIKTEGIKRKNQVEKQKTTDDSYLFILRSIPDDYLISRDEELRKMTENAILKLYRNISRKAKKNTKEGSYNVIRSHTMRKYFNSAMLNAGADSFYVEFFMGHALDDTQSAYFRAIPEKMKQIYLKYVPYLIVEKSLDVSVSPEFIQMFEENKNLKIENERVSIDRLEIQRANAETVQEIQKIKAEHDQQINDIQSQMKERELQFELRMYDKMKMASTGKERERYAKMAQNVREQLKKYK